MGNSQNFCIEQNLNSSILQIPTSLNQGLQINLKVNTINKQVQNFGQHIPTSSYARKATVMPILSQKVQQTLNQILKSEWQYGLPNGKGWFKKGQAEGEDNIFIYPDGSFYRGSFRNSIKNGYGVLFFHTGFQYQGTWKDGVPHGQKCRQKYPNKSIYIGNFNNGVKQGRGVYIWPDQKRYIGQFRNGYMEGYGILQKGKQSYFQGQFVQNMKQGFGRMKLKYGTYQGPFQNGLISGQGKFIWNDGKIYTGKFYNGKIHGKGEMKFKNGAKIVGQWVNGENTTNYKIVQK